MNTISLNRLKYLFREYFLLHWKRDLMIMVSMFLVQIGLSYLDISFFGILSLIVIVMPIIQCSTLNTWHKGTWKINYLLCPANTMEKIITNILLVHIYYTLMILLSCILGGFSLYLLHYSIFLLSYEYITLFVVLFIIQSIFLFTSIYFKKNVILKTMLFFTVLIVAIWLIITYTGIGNIMVNIDEWQTRYLTFHSVINGVYFTNLVAYSLYRYAWVFRVLLCITPIFFWVLTYFRLRETEV